MDKSTETQVRHRVDGIAFLLYSFLIDLRAEEMIETAKGKMESYHELYCV